MAGQQQQAFDFAAGFDLRNANPGRVSDLVRDQRKDPTCAAMTVIELVQSAHAKRMNVPAPNLSVQQLISGTHYARPPEMPNMLQFFNYAKKNRFVLEETYPYLGPKYGNDGSTLHRFNKSIIRHPAAISLQRYVHVEDDVDAVARHVFFQRMPVSIALVVNTNYFDEWLGKSEIYVPDASKTNDYHGHRVVVVGYGMEEMEGEERKYFIIKNSNGPTWGENGYGRIVAASKYCGERILAFSAE